MLMKEKTIQSFESYGQSIKPNLGVLKKPKTPKPEESNNLLGQPDGFNCSVNQI